MEKRKNTRIEQGRNIPALRFPGFGGEWKKTQIKDFAPLQRGFDLPVDRIVEGKYPVVFSNGILKFHNEFKVKAPGVVTGRSGTIGKVTYVESDFWAHNTSLWVTDFKDNHPKFVYYFYSRYKLERFGTGSGVPTLNRNDIHVQIESFPDVPEQQKIASFFTAIDKKISQLKKKHQLLEQYKKGVMQKIFSQEIRFKPALSEVEGDDDGKEFPKWEKKRLGDISQKKASTVSANTIEENIGEYPIYGATGFLKSVDFYLESDDYISIVKDGAGVGRLLYCNGKSSVLGTLDIIKPKAGMNTFFLYLLLSQIDFTKFITGSTIPHIYYKDYSKTSLFIPSEKEQTKIANFLSAIDDKIQHTQKQIEQAELWKKGLMQQMFV